MTPFDFETGHNIPESKGGETKLDNLRAICSQCSKSMANRYTLDEFSYKFSPFTDAAEKHQKDKDKKRNIKIFACF
jgi:5-methylcytosine-specific restriction endonuclease McrA